MKAVPFGNTARGGERIAFAKQLALSSQAAQVFL
jgi:hypothetical protein